MFEGRGLGFEEKILKVMGLLSDSSGPQPNYTSKYGPGIKRCSLSSIDVDRQISQSGERMQIQKSNL